MQNEPKSLPTDVYTIVTNRIIEHLKKGVIPWQQPWTEPGLPKNLITGKNYRGINVWLLASLNYPQNYFLTFKQIKDLGARVKKGEKSQEVIFWKWLDSRSNERDNGESRDSKDKGDKTIQNEEIEKIKKVPLLKYYRVFNIDQCEGIPKEKIPQVIVRANKPIITCEKIINEMPNRPEIKHEDYRAYYHKLDDFINMPRKESFGNSEGYYGTLFHELVHSTGHSERLNRKEIIRNNGFRTEGYAIEELTAEMGASYLKSYAGIPIEQLRNNAAYIQTWLERLRNDKKFIVYASSQAQKATDYILNIKNEEKEIEVIDENKVNLNFNEREHELSVKRCKNSKNLIEIDM